VEFDILLVLADGEAHGYAIIREAQERDPAGRRIETGTLYRALRRLVSDGLIRPAEPRPAEEAEDGRRSYYAITPFGRVVAQAEARRLAAQVEAARSRALLAPAKGGGR
jgi:DNA-binding PadR family transcriptional regulator